MKIYISTERLKQVSAIIEFINNANTQEKGLILQSLLSTTDVRSYTNRKIEGVQQIDGILKVK